VAFRLVNQNETDMTLSITNDTWYGILDLAGEYGWNPMGTVIPGEWSDLEIALAGYYPGVAASKNGNGNVSEVIAESRMVVLEDALNLADALDQAFLEYEPRRMPASFFLFEPPDSSVGLRPSIGAIAAVADFCRRGPFWVETLKLPTYRY
jgi:hypothetical protein